MFKKNKRFFFYKIRNIVYIYDSFFQTMFYKEKFKINVYVKDLKQLEEPLLQYKTDDCSIRINPGNTCNFNCKYCFAHKEKQNVEKEIRLTDNALNYFIQKYNGSVTGYWIMYYLTGETFLNIKGLTEFLERIKSYRLKYQDKWFGYFFQTNGSILNDSIITLLHKNDIKDLTISLDGNSKINDSLRQFFNGNGTYKTIIKNIKILEKENITVSLSSVITKKYPHPYKILKSFLQISNISKICMRPVRDTRYNVSLFQYPILFFEYNKIYNLMFKKIKQGDFSVFNKLKNDYLLEPLKYLVTQKKVVYRCSYDYQYCVDKNGDLYPCDYTIGLEEFKLGSIYNTKNIKERKLSSVLTNKKCNHCTFKYLCGGTCYYKSFIKYKDIYHIDYKECLYRKTLIKKSLRFYCKLLNIGFSKKQIETIFLTEAKNENIDKEFLWNEIVSIKKSNDIIVINKNKNKILFSNKNKQLTFLSDKELLKIFNATTKKYFLKKSNNLSTMKLVNFNKSIENLNINSIIQNKFVTIININKIDFSIYQLELEINLAEKEKKEVILQIQENCFQKSAYFSRFYLKQKLLGNEKIHGNNIKIKYYYSNQTIQTLLAFIPPAIRNIFVVYEIYDYELINKFDRVAQLQKELLIHGYQTELRINYTDSKYLLNSLKYIRKIDVTTIILNTTSIIKDSIKLMQFYRHIFKILSKSIIYEQDYSFFIKLKEDICIKTFINLINKTAKSEHISKQLCNNCCISSFCPRCCNINCDFLRNIGLECIKFEFFLLNNSITPRNFEFLKSIN